MQYKLLLVIILAVVYATEVRFTYSGRAYDTIHQVLGSSGYAVPDCGHHVEHITTVHDSDLNRNVFALDLHVNLDDDRCINQDRQRTEMAVDAGSPSWMHGSDGKALLTIGSLNWMRASRSQDSSAISIRLSLMAET